MPRNRCLVANSCSLGSFLGTVAAWSGSGCFLTTGMLFKFQRGKAEYENLRLRGLRPLCFNGPVLDSRVTSDSRGNGTHRGCVLVWLSKLATCWVIFIGRPSRAGPVYGAFFEVNFSPEDIWARLRTYLRLILLWSDIPTYIIFVCDHYEDHL